MYAPGALWTAAHHSIPMLTIMFNNRGYHQEVMHVQRMCNRRQRGVENAHIGTAISGPNVNYAQLASAMGQVGIGPIDNPKDLPAALKRGIDVAKSGGPAAHRRRHPAALRRTDMRRIGISVVASALLLAAPSFAADAGKGRATFVRAGCWECHGYEGQGGVGPKLAPGPVAAPALKAFVRTTSGDMPAYTAKILSDADLDDIYAYLQSIPKSPDPKTIPLLQ